MVCASALNFLHRKICAILEPSIIIIIKYNKKASGGSRLNKGGGVGEWLRHGTENQEVTVSKPGCSSNVVVKLEFSSRYEMIR